MNHTAHHRLFPQPSFPDSISRAKSLSSLESFDRMRLFKAIQEQVVLQAKDGRDGVLSVPIIRPTVLADDDAYKEYCRKVMRAIYAFSKHRCVTVLIYTVFSLYLEAFHLHDRELEEAHPIDIPVRTFFLENGVDQHPLSVQQEVYLRTFVNITAGVAYVTVSTILVHLTGDESYESDPELIAACDRVRAAIDFSDVMHYRARIMKVGGPLLFRPKEAARVLCTAIPAVMTHDLPTDDISTLFSLTPPAANDDGADDD